MKDLFLLCLAATLNAATIPISVPIQTQTQVAIKYTATTAGSCTITAVDNNSGPVVADVDATKFANANLDLSRTVVNGFKFPTLISGLTRTVFIGGHNEIKLGTDGKYYSTALQVNSSHSITVACNSGADTGTITTNTRNLPLASAYPETTTPTPGSPLGGFPQPTIDWSRAGRSILYLDPITGVPIQRVTGGDDYFEQGNPIANSFQSTIIDVNGSAWTNKANFNTNQASGTLATTSTVNAPVFAAFDPAFAPSAQTISDIIVTPYGNASSNSIISEWCISLDSGNNCANFTPIDVTYTTVARCQSTGNCATSQIPSSTPGSFYAGWGGMKVAHGVLDMRNLSFNTVNVSGSTVTLTAPDDPRGPKLFSLGIAAGSKFLLTGCTGATPANPLTVSVVNSPTSITTVETGIAAGTGCLYTDMHAGIRLIMKNAGTLNASFQAQAWVGRDFDGGTSGGRYYCSKSKVTDINKDCDGVDHTGAPLSGYLCEFTASSFASIFLVQDNGRMCNESDLFGGTPGHLQNNFTPSWIDNKSMVGTDFATPTHIWKAAFTGTDYTEMPVDTGHVLDTKMTYTDLGPSAPSNSQMIALGGPVAQAVSSGIWNTFGLETVIEDKNGNLLFQYNSQSGQNQSCQKAFADISGTVISTMPGYGSYPLGYTVCHGSPAGGGGYVSVGVEGNGLLAPSTFNTSIPVGGPWVSNVTGVRKNGSWVNTSITISACTKANPAVCTSAGHNIDQVSTFTNATAGALLTISGATGTGWSTGLNGPLYAHAIAGNNTFSLYTDPAGSTGLDSTGFGTLGGTITATLSKPVYSFRIASVSGTTTARITIDNTEGGPIQYYPTFATTGIANLMFDADPITIVATYLNSTNQYYAKVSCAGCSNVQFDLYSNSALSTPVSSASLGAVAGFYVLYAETCPSAGSVTLPGPMYMDTGFTVAGVPKVRCVGLRLGSEMESNFPSAGEHAAYPPPSTSSEFTNVNKSMLHQINVGDGMMDLAHIGGNHEILYTLSVDRSVSENQIDTVMERVYGDDPLYGWHGSQNTPASDPYAQQHSPGWQVAGAGIIPQAIFDPTTMPVTYYIGAVNGSHHDLVTGSGPGKLTNASNDQPGDPDDQVDVTISTYINFFTSTHNSVPQFNSNGPSFSYTSLLQSYPSKRNIFNQTSTTERVWKSDWLAGNQAFGNSKNFLDGVGGRNVTFISGIVWKVDSFSPINVKVAPLYVSAYPYNQFVDASGPTWSKTDGTFCAPYYTNDCSITGSVQGEVYIAAKTLRSTGAALTNAFANDSTLGAPAAFGLSPAMGWAVQIRQSPIDTNATGVRRLTMGFMPPLGEYSFTNWVSSPDGKWGFFAGNPLNMRPMNNALGSHVFAIKLPPWPTSSDGLDRTKLVQIPIPLGGVSGDNIRIAFGYGENGDPANFYCTTRPEKCWTTNTPTSTNPFVFDLETQVKTPCSPSCTVPIPAIPGRITWYQVERTNGASTVLGPMQVIDDSAAVPIAPASFFPGRVVMSGKTIAH